MIKASLKKLSVATFVFLVLLLALSPVSSVFAQGLGHAFYGTVKVGGVDAAIGTVISAQVAGTEYGSCIVTTPGSYALIVQGDIADGATIDFYVAGQKADQTFLFHDGWTTQLDLTVTIAPTTYQLTISSTVGGNVTTPGEGTFPYVNGSVVRLVASPDAGYKFVNWTGNVATVANVTAASTNITMHGNYSIMANFVAVYNLVMAVAPTGTGNATDLTNASPYAAGAAVRIKAVANPGYGFVNWTANATVTFDDATAAETTFRMPTQAVTVTAHFGVAYALTMAADPVAGGGAIDVGAKGAYAADAAVRIKAVANPGYGFVNWTAPPAVTFADATAEETTFPMPAQAVTVTAHFGVAYNLTMAADPGAGGHAIDVGAKGAYAANATVRIKAEPVAGYAFGNWTATAGEFGSVTAAATTFTMPAQAVTVTAHFEVVAPSVVPTVTTECATAISSYSGTVNMNYTMGNFSPVEVRFACKRSTDPAWFYSTWVSRTADGNYAEVLTGLVSQTQYEFKAQLKYISTVIEGASRQFTTATGASTSLNDLLGYFGCFIATAAYGSPTAEQIDVLREFRDEVLLESTVGFQFVALYYRLSPPIADFIARSDLLRTLVRELLVDPIVWIVEATGDMWRN